MDLTGDEAKNAADADEFDDDDSDLGEDEIWKVGLIRAFLMPATDFFPSLSGDASKHASRCRG
jgi:hypothetical protein